MCDDGGVTFSVTVMSHVTACDNYTKHLCRRPPPRCRWSYTNYDDSPFLVRGYQILSNDDLSLMVSTRNIWTCYHKWVALNNLIILSLYYIYESPFVSVTQMTYCCGIGDDSLILLPRLTCLPALSRRVIYCVLRIM